MKSYRITLSMGHDTGLQFYGTVVETSLCKALNTLWAHEYWQNHEEIEKIYKVKGFRYLPYYFVHEVVKE